MSLLSHILTFAKSPTLEITTTATTKNKIWNIVRLWAFFALVAFSSGFLQDPFLKAVGFEAKDHAVAQALTNENPLLFILGATILAPIIEEITFRLWLRPTRRNLSLSLGFLSSIIVNLIATQFIGKLAFLTSLGDNILALLGAFFGPYLICTLFFYFLLGNTRIQSKVSEFLTKHFRVFFYVATALFASAHLTNYDPTKVWFLTPILILPQLIVGFYLGYVRLNYGFSWSVLAHGLHNSILIPFVAALGLVSEPTKALILSGSDNPTLFENLPPADSLALTIAGILMILEIVAIIGLAIQVVVEWLQGRRQKAFDQPKT